MHRQPAQVWRSCACNSGVSVNVVQSQGSGRLTPQVKPALQRGQHAGTNANVVAGESGTAQDHGVLAFLGLLTPQA